MSGIWQALVGQDDVVADLQRAVADAESRTRGEPGPAMTHAWLFTGPPGSGRSTAATCFAAALVCPEGGCGVCQVCRTAPFGGHPDVEVVRPQGVNYGVDEARALVKTAGFSPANSFWHVVVVEDADRLTDEAVNVLLKSIEEPPPHTVWILCAPSVEDVLPTIVSRTRHVALRTPSARDVADLLVELENSPMASQVMSLDLSKPTIKVQKPEKGDTTMLGYGGNTGMMGMMGGMGRGGRGGMGGMMEGMEGGMGMAGGMGGRGGMGGMMEGMEGGMGMGMGGVGDPKKGVDVRSKDRRKEREAAEKNLANRARFSLQDPYYNVVEVSVYGQARFYVPPPPPEAVASEGDAAAEAPAEGAEKPADPAKPAEPKAAEAAPEKAEQPKADEAKPAEPKAAEAAPEKAEQPKADTPKN